MEVVIKIPDEVYSDIQKGIIRKHIDKVFVAIANGTPIIDGDVEKAVEILRNYHNGYFGYKIDDVKKAHNLAINALATSSTRPQGEWIDHSEDYGYTECPLCHELTNCEGNIEELHYCWNCGAELRKGGKEE